MKRITFLFALLLSFTMTSCLDAQINSGSGNETSTPVDQLTDFDAIALGTSADVYVTPGDFDVRMEGPKDDLDRMVLNVEDGQLSIGKKSGNWNWSRSGVKVYVSMPTIRTISIGGSGNVQVTEAFEQLGDLNISIGGAGDVDFKGKMAKEVEISVAGSGDVDASELNAASCDVSIAGSGDVKIGEVEQLKVSVAGSGDVRYKGNPTINKSIVGSGDVIKM
ncbi:MAG: hypothetical protein GVY26_19790 [Bacteroidetes bacterium]|jgi:hypothetical protein|nr:hypothetical protein [Bacteroidota bacterium]